MAGLKLMAALIGVGLGFSLLSGCINNEAPKQDGLIIYDENGNIVDPNATPNPNPDPTPVPTPSPEPDTLIDTTTLVQTGLASHVLLGKWAISTVSRAVMSVSTADTSSRDSLLDVSADANYFSFDSTGGMTYVTALSPLNVQIRQSGGNVSEAQISACEAKMDGDSCTYLRQDTLSTRGTCRTNNAGVHFCQRTGGGQNGGNQAAYDACKTLAVNAACTFSNRRRETTGQCIPDTADVPICARKSSADELAVCAGKAQGAECAVLSGNRERNGSCGVNIIGEFVCVMQRRTPGEGRGAAPLQKIAARPARLDSGTWAYINGLLALFSALPPDIPQNASDSLRAELEALRDTTVYVPNINGGNITFSHTRSRVNTRNNIATKTTTFTVYTGQKQ